MRAFSQSFISGGLPLRRLPGGTGALPFVVRAAISPEFTANTLSSSTTLSF
jgi:hypothetical protein